MASHTLPAFAGFLTSIHAPMALQRVPTITKRCPQMRMRQILSEGLLTASEQFVQPTFTANNRVQGRMASRIDDAPLCLGVLAGESDFFARFLAPFGAPSRIATACRCAT